MYEVVFFDCCDDETVVNEKFATEELAEEWAYDKLFDYSDIAIDENGNDYFKTFYRYYNPEDNCSNYVGYWIKPLLDAQPL